MRYPTEYWSMHLRYWWGTLGMACLLAVLATIGVGRGDELFACGMAILLIVLAYRRVLIIRIPPHAMVMRYGKVFELCLRRDMRMIWDPRVRAARIVPVPHSFLKKTYDAHIIFPSQEFRICVCAVSIRVGHIMQCNAWQRFYDRVVRGRSNATIVIEMLLKNAIQGVGRMPLGTPDERSIRGHVIPCVVCAMNKSLYPAGLRVRCVTTIFTIETTHTYLKAYAG